MRTYRVEGLVKVRTADGRVVTVRPVHYGEYSSKHGALAQFKMEHPGATNISWNIV